LPAHGEELPADGEELPADGEREAGKLPASESVSGKSTPSSFLCRRYEGAPGISVT